MLVNAKYGTNVSVKVSDISGVTLLSEDRKKSEANKTIMYSNDIICNTNQ